MTLYVYHKFNPKTPTTTPTTPAFNRPGLAPITEPELELDPVDTVVEFARGGTVIATVGPPIPPASVKVVPAVGDVALAELLVSTAAAVGIRAGVVYALTYDISK